jgi:hypothetical protein
MEEDRHVVVPIDAFFCCLILFQRDELTGSELLALTHLFSSTYTMFKRAGNSLKPHFRRLHSQASSSTSSVRQGIRAYPKSVASTGVAAAYILWYTSTHTIHNDATASTASPIALGKAKQLSLLSGGDVGESDELRAVVWGSNRCVLC